MVPPDVRTPRPEIRLGQLLARCVWTEPVRTDWRINTCVNKPPDGEDQSGGGKESGVGSGWGPAPPAWPCFSSKQEELKSSEWGVPSGSDGKESARNAGDLGLIPGLGRSPGGGHGSPLQYSCLENPQGQRSLEGYSPWGHKVTHD